MTRKQKQTSFTIVVVNIVALSSACGSEEGVKTGDVGPAPDTGNREELFCPSGPPVCFGTGMTSTGVPLTTAALAVVDNSGVTTAHLRVQTPGTVCMSGTSVGTASLILWLATSDLPPIREGAAVATLDLASRKVASLSFAVDTPPSTGVLVSFSSYPPALCASGSQACPPARFTLSQRGVPAVITTSGTTTAPLTDFLPSEPAYAIADGVAALTFQAGLAEHYDFCVHDVKFLDGAGNDIAAL